MTKKQLQQKRRYLKRKQLLDQLLYEQPQSLKANTFVSMDSRHKLTRFHKTERIEISHNLCNRKEGRKF